MQQRRGMAIFESRKGLLSFFSWCCGFFMIGYVVFFSRSFSFFLFIFTQLSNPWKCNHLFGRITNPLIHSCWIANPAEQVSDYKSSYSQRLGSLLFQHSNQSDFVHNYIIWRTKSFSYICLIHKFLCEGNNVVSII